MTIYFVIFFFLLCAVMAGFQPKKSLLNKGLYVFAVILLILCAGLRAESVGTDYGTYHDYFVASPDTLGIGFIGQWIGTLPAVGIGYVYLNSLIKMIGLPFEALIFLVALTVVSLTALFFWKNSRFAAIALMMYYSNNFFQREMIAIRSGLAGVLALWGFHFWANHRRWIGIVLMVIAFLFHFSVAVVIIPIAFDYLKIKTKYEFVLATLIVAVFVGNNINSSFPMFSQIDRLSILIGTSDDLVLGIFSNPVTIEHLVILSVSCWLIKSRKDKVYPPILRLCITSYWISTLWLICFNQFSILGARGYSLLGIGEPLIVAQIVVVFFEDRLLRQYRRIVSFAVICFAMSIFVLYLKNSKVNGFINEYKTVFQESMLLSHHDDYL